MKLVLVDTDILIEVLRGRDATIKERWERLLSTALIAYSPVTAAEVWQGAWPKERTATEELFGALTCLEIDANIGRKAGEFLGAYGPSHSLELGDSLIAATAAIHRVSLWTRNRKHYPMPDIIVHRGF